MKQLLFIILVVCSTLANAKTATIKIERKTGKISLTDDEGTTTIFHKSAARPLGDVIPEDDEDTVRGTGEHDNNDIIGMQFVQDQDGNKKIDRDGVAHIGGHIYDLKQIGTITENEDEIVVKVSMEKPNVHGKGKAGNRDVKKLPDAIQEEIKDRRERAIRNASGKRQEKRNTKDKLWVELAVFVDQGFWDEYVRKYRSRAEGKVHGFVEIMLDAMQSDYKSLRPPIYLNINKFEIWKSQPSVTSAAKKDGSIDDYVDALPESDYNPEVLNVDHTMVLSGYGLYEADTLGIAFTGPLCEHPAWAVSVINTFDVTVGETAAHELAHSFGVHHDGQEDTTHEEECLDDDDLMSPYIKTGDTSDKQWSRCSRKRIQTQLKRWDSEGLNCLTNQPSNARENDEDSTDTYSPCKDERSRSQCRKKRRSCKKSKKVRRQCAATCGLC